MWWALLTTSPDMAVWHRREAHFAREEAVGGKVWCGVARVSEDGAVTGCWTTLSIGMTWRWLHSLTNPRRRRLKWMWLRATTVSPVRKLALILPWGKRRKGAKRPLSLARVACNGKRALVCGWAAVSGDFRSQMRVAWPRSGFTITWRQTEQVWINVIHPNQLPGWRPCSYICTPPSENWHHDYMKCLFLVKFL